MVKKVVAALCTVATLIGSAAGLSKKPEEPVNLPIVEIEYDEVYYLPYALSMNEWNEIYCAVMGESEGEGFDGQMMVANCIINKCRLAGKTPHEVITGDAYSDRCSYYSLSVKKAVDAVFIGGQRPLGDYATIFYAPSGVKGGYSDYHESQIYVLTAGGHKFFAERKFVTEGVTV